MKLKVAVGFSILLFVVFMSYLMISRSTQSGPTQTQVITTDSDVANGEQTESSDITLTAEMVAEHNVQDDCWTIIDGNVYDVTLYIPRHPGGIRDIVRVCGDDGTEGFNTKGGEGEGHLPSTETLLQEFLIGSLDDGL